MDSAIGELLLKLGMYVAIFYAAVWVLAKLFVSKGFIGDILNIIWLFIRKIALILIILLVVGLALTFLGVI